LIEKPYIASDLIIITGDRNKTQLANYNQAAGMGFTIFDGKTPIACGGVRVQGIGVAWFAMSEEAKKHPVSVIRKAKKRIEEMQRKQEVCELFAESVDTDKWLESLGFKKNDNIYMR